MRREDLAVLHDLGAPHRTVLLPPYDPITELADRELLVPVRGMRRQIWRPAANPGVVLARGELAGIWRQRTRRKQLELTVTSFGEGDRTATEADAQHLDEAIGHTGVAIQWTS